MPDKTKILAQTPWYHKAFPGTFAEFTLAIFGKNKPSFAMAKEVRALLKMVACVHPKVDNNIKTEMKITPPSFQKTFTASTAAIEFPAAFICSKDATGSKAR